MIDLDTFEDDMQASHDDIDGCLWLLNASTEMAKELRAARAVIAAARAIHVLRSDDHLDVYRNDRLLHSILNYDAVVGDPK